MTILTLLIAICLIALCFWANNTYVTPPIVRIIVNVILIIICLAVLLNFVGWMPSMDSRISRH